MKENEKLYVAIESINTDAQSIRSLADVVLGLFEKSEDHDLSDIDFANIFRVIQSHATDIAKLSWVIASQDEREEVSEESQSAAEQLLSLRVNAYIQRKEAQ